MNKNFEKLVTTMSVFTDTLTPLTESPFKVVDDKAMRDLTESIKKFGILEPITVRKPDDTKAESLKSSQAIADGKRVKI